MRRFEQFFIGAAMAGVIAVVGADDTDVYVNTNPPPNVESEAQIMIILDWRPNLASTASCTDIEVDDPDNPGSTVTVNECEYIFDPYMEDLNEDGRYQFLEVIVAALKTVVKPLDNIHLGLMLNHDDGRTGCGVGIEYANDPPPGDLYCSDGGFVLIGLKDMDVPAQEEEFYYKLGHIPIPEGKESHKFQGRQVYFELFRYLTGQAIHNGHLGWNDYGTDGEEVKNGGFHYNIDNPKDTPPEEEATGMWDPSIEDGPNYVRPELETGVCGSFSIINMMHQVSQQEEESDEHIRAPLDEGGMAIQNLNVWEDVLEWFRDAGLVTGLTDSNGAEVVLPNIKSWFMVDGSKVDNIKTNSYARAGGTGPTALSLSEEPQELLDNLRNVFKQILSVSTTFVAPSVAVNIVNRAQVLNDVYLSLFEPAEDVTPRWAGNLKKIKIGQDTDGSFVLRDALGNNAIAADGRLNHYALTFWTVGDELPPPTEARDEFVNGRDGRTVKRGAAGQMMPGFRPPPVSQAGPGAANSTDPTTNFTVRKLYTEPDTYTNGTVTTLMGFNADDTTAGALLDGAAGDRNIAVEQQLYQDGLALQCLVADCVTAPLDADAELAMAKAGMMDLIKFGRGMDLDDEDEDLTTTDAQPWLMGDALHSRPVPVNYGNASDPSNPVVRIVYGSNDGWFRMIRAEDGVEAWAFMPRAVMTELRRLRTNEIGVPIHPYLVDGEPRVVILDNNKNGHVEAGSPENDRVLAIFGLRRGGKHYYALDITDPDAPKLLWSISSAETGFEQLGQTWAPPRAGRIMVDIGTDTLNKVVLLIGGGYNGDDGGDKVDDLGKDERDPEDEDNGTVIGVTDGTFVGSDDDEGNAIFMIDALTGELIWKAVDTDVDGAVAGSLVTDDRVFQHPRLEDSIPSPVFGLDTNNDGFIDRFYVGDTGGNVWRGDLAGTDRSNWSLTQIAKLGRHFNATTADDRRFLHRLDFAKARDEAGDFDAIVIGSGDRAHPLSMETNNYVYMIKDRATMSGVPPSEAAENILDHDDLADLTDNCAAQSTCTLETEGKLNNNGWRIRLEQCDGLESTGLCGEKLLSSPFVSNGVVMFNTYLPADPDATTCTPVEGGGLFYAIALQDAGSVLNFTTINDIDGVVLDRFEELDSRGIPSELAPLGIDTILRGDLRTVDFSGLPTTKTFWYEEDRGGTASGL